MFPRISRLASLAALLFAFTCALPATAAPSPEVRFNTVSVDGIKIFYREARPKNGPTVLLLHGLPTSSHMYRGLIPLLADKYHVIAPDLPGFGFSDVPARSQYHYTFDNLAKTMKE